MEAQLQKPNQTVAEPLEHPAETPVRQEGAEVKVKGREAKVVEDEAEKVVLGITSSMLLSLLQKDNLLR